MLAPEKNWWKPMGRMEKTWLTVALAWCIFLTVMMPLWYFYGKQNVPTETYRTTPTDYGDKVNAFVEHMPVIGGPGFQTGFGRVPGQFQGPYARLGRRQIALVNQGGNVRGDGAKGRQIAQRGRRLAGRRSPRYGTRLGWQRRLGGLGAAGEPGEQDRDAGRGSETGKSTLGEHDVFLR